MENVKKSLLWIEAGYDLFGKEGLNGIQIERLARIVGLNKSGFYHYFADLDGYFAEIVKFHQHKIDQFLNRLAKIEKLDPDYLLLLVEFSSPVLFQMQATRSQSHPPIFKVGAKVDQQVNVAVTRLWSTFLDLKDRPDLAAKYYDVARDMFYVKVTPGNFSYEMLHNLATEIKFLIHEIANRAASVSSQEAQ